jgi:hypothetical protein
MANFFPRWTNWLPLKLLICAGAVGTALVAGVWYYCTPSYARVGYQPDQPIAFPHDVHVDQLGMDCRYCHSFVEVAAHSNVPTTQTCMNCHSQVQKDNPKLQPLRDSAATGKPIDWVQIHKTPDFVFFNHSAHVNRGVSCASCHGDVNHMSVVYHHQPHSMAWCLTCHRAPEQNLRPPEQVFNLDWKPEDEDPKAFMARFGIPHGESEEDWSRKSKLTREEIGRTLRDRWKVNPPENCAGCHR